MAIRYLRSVMKRICLCAASLSSQDWSKHDEKLLQAVDGSDPEKVASLLNKRTLHTTKLDTEGRSAYHLAAMRGHVDCLEVILAHGVDVTALDGSGLNALHLAAKYGNHQCVKRLLQERCPVNAVDSYGRIALHHAATSGSFSCVQTLCNFKSPLNVHDDDGCTPLILAAQMSNYEMCRCLIVRGGDVNTRDKQGRTALMLACENDSVETVDVLVRSGANVSLVDALGHDAGHYSMVTGNTDILQLLHLVPHRSFWNSEPELRRRQHQVLAKDKTTSPRKRQAPLPPSTPSTQSPSQSSEFLSTGESTSPSYSSTETLTPKNDQRLSEEVDLLQQERQHLLQTISNLEQLVDKCQREKVLIAKDCGIQKLENQIQELTNKLTEKEKEHQDVTQQVETLKGRLSLYEQGKHQEDNKSELMVEEEMLDSFPAIEKLLSKKGVHNSSEEWLLSLQSQVESLTSENQELQGRLQELEYSEKGANEGDSSGSLDFIPVLLYDSLQAEFEKLKEQHEQAQATIREEVNSATCEKLVSLEAYEQLKVEHRQEVQRLQEVLDDLKAKTDSKIEDSSRDERLEVKDIAEHGSQDVEELIKKLKDTQHKYEAAMSEVQQLEEQIQLGILSVEEKATMRNTGTIKTVPGEESVKMELLRAGNTEVEEERKVKTLEEKVSEMEKALTHSVPLEEYNEMRMSLNTSLEEISKQNLLLVGKYTKVEGELEDLKRSHFGESPENGTGASIEAKEQLEELNKVHNELQEKYKELQTEYEKKVEELKSIQLLYVPKEEHEKVKDKLCKSLSEANNQLHDLKVTHNAIQQEIARLEDEIEQQRKSSICWGEHLKMKESLEKSLQDTKGMVSNMKDQLATKDKEISQQQEEAETMKRQTIRKEEHEKITTSLKDEVNSLIVKLNDLTKKHEKTCTEVFRVQRQALFMKSEKQAAEEEMAAAQKQLSDLKAESTKIIELHKHIEDSAGLVKEKERKITELSKEVLKLKEALNSLSEKLNAATLPPKPASHSNQQHTESTQKQIRSLQQQLAQAESEHRATVTIYRSHLLYAVQGQMDEDVQNVLLQILKMHKHRKQAM
ncbi:ankyrin repeat domain-containing protein 24-like isoform X2 [Scyliorhinus canicula]|uniref:ankyrin repeat domain-containing protein 24-like isoform X2 n=1 Tax=Scyliorhinus canicula TaxID=7830 RepID=UPI0018F59566|nr:ankyrin repeat domain-containing protein 24-like isoform X2 [Scyliorhinus canicula]